jgi:hypothetical protein
MIREDWLEADLKACFSVPVNSGRYTQAERDRDRELQNRGAQTIHNRRKATPSGQNYNVPGDKASKAKDLRLLGER